MNSRRTSSQTRQMLREGLSYRFTRAVVRKPGGSVVNGLRTAQRGPPDVKLFQYEHDRYVEVLQRAGLCVNVLPPLEVFPDSVFIEDTALCLPEGVIILRPGATSRAGEAGETARALADLGQVSKQINTTGTIDGGDILVTDSMILIGLSERTNKTGFDALKQVLERWGYTVQAVQTPGNVLHFKSDCSLLDSETILSTSRLSAASCFSTFKVLTVPPGEDTSKTARAFQPGTQ